MSEVYITIREVQSAELPNVALLIERANAQRDGETLPDALSDNGPIESLRTKIGKPDVWADVAVVEDRIAGVVLGHPASEAKDLPSAYSDAEYVSLLMVDPDYWGKHIASALLSTASERARNANKHKLMLSTRIANNQHARDAYEHKGFVQTGDVRPSKYGMQMLYLLNL